MLYPAQLYREELKRKLISCWYNPKYDWYFCGEYREFDVPDNTDWRRDFVHLNRAGEVDGYFSYCFNAVARSVSQFGLIAFSDKGAPFVKDCVDHMNKLVAKGLRRVEWWAVSDNPVNKWYKKLIQKYNGHVIGTLHECNYFSGEYHDSIIYEILFKGCEHHKDNELKPCPFCGSNSVWVADNRLNDSFIGYTVHCNGCGVETSYTKNKDKAIEKWNRRNEDD